MKSGAPAFGTPEYIRATQMTGQLARFYGLPLRSSGVCAANVPDGQSIWETSNSLWAAYNQGQILYIMLLDGWKEVLLQVQKNLSWIVKLYSKSRGIWTQNTCHGSDSIAISAIKKLAVLDIFLVWSTHKGVTKVLFISPFYLIGKIMKHGRLQVQYGHLNVHISYTNKFFMSLQNH